MIPYLVGTTVWALIDRFCDGIPADKMWREVMLLETYIGPCRTIMYYVHIIGTNRSGFVRHQNTKLPHRVYGPD